MDFEIDLSFCLDDSWGLVSKGLYTIEIAIFFTYDYLNIIVSFS